MYPVTSAVVVPALASSKAQDDGESTLDAKVATLRRSYRRFKVDEAMRPLSARLSISMQEAANVAAARREGRERCVTGTAASSYATSECDDEIPGDAAQAFAAPGSSPCQSQPLRTGHLLQPQHIRLGGVDINNDGAAETTGDRLSREYWELRAELRRARESEAGASREELLRVVRMQATEAALTATTPMRLACDVADQEGSLSATVATSESDLVEASPAQFCGVLTNEAIDRLTTALKSWRTRSFVDAVECHRALPPTAPADETFGGSTSSAGTLAVEVPTSHGNMPHPPASVRQSAQHAFEVKAKRDVAVDTNSSLGGAAASPFGPNYNGDVCSTHNARFPLTPKCFPSRADLSAKVTVPKCSRSDKLHHPPSAKPLLARPTTIGGINVEGKHAQGIHAKTPRGSSASALGLDPVWCVVVSDDAVTHAADSVWRPPLSRSSEFEPSGQPVNPFVVGVGDVPNVAFGVATHVIDETQEEELSVEALRLSRDILALRAMLSDNVAPHLYSRDEVLSHASRRIEGGTSETRAGPHRMTGGGWLSPSLPYEPRATPRAREPHVAEPLPMPSLSSVAAVAAVSICSRSNRGTAAIARRGSGVQPRSHERLVRRFIR